MEDEVLNVKVDVSTLMNIHALLFMEIRIFDQSFKTPLDVTHDRKTKDTFVVEYGGSCIHRLRSNADSIFSPFVDTSIFTPFVDTSIGCLLLVPEQYQTETFYLICRTTNALHVISKEGKARVLFHIDNSLGLQDIISMRMDSKGRLLMLDRNNHRILQLILDKEQVSGNTSIIAGWGSDGEKHVDSFLASFYHPSGMCLDQDDNCYVADRGNASIKRIDAQTRELTIFAGDGFIRHRDGPCLSASFHYLRSLEYDPHTNMLFVSELHSIRMIHLKSRQVITLAGTDDNPSYVNGDGRTARFQNPSAIAIESNLHSVELLSLIRSLACFSDWPPGLLDVVVMDYITRQIINLLVIDEGNNIVRRIHVELPCSSL